MFLVTQIWFPDLLFDLENVWQGLQILIPVDAILGPVLTLILFVPGKKGLIGDLIIIATIQILALVYGGMTIYGQRPEVIVFAGDRFEIIPSSKFDRENFAAQYFEEEESTFPLLVYALPAQTPEESNTFVLNNVQYQKMADRYRPLADHKDLIRKKALALSKFEPSNEASLKELSNFKEKFTENEVLLFVLEGTTHQAKLIALHPQTLQKLGYLNLDPWTEYKATD